MNRQAALDTLNDRINGEGSGEVEWLRWTKSNNSFNPTRDCVPFILVLRVEDWMLLARGGLIRALDFREY
jgi:hypothetical protein